MKFFLISLTIPFIVSIASAQTAEDSVKATVNNLFQAMKNGDVRLLSSCFADSAILQTIIKTKEGKTEIENELVKEFADFVSKQKKNMADERITFETIKIDGPLAMVWAPYQFYYDGKFSHCGVDSFQLINTPEGWKIQYLVDTRRKVNCK
ncbi:MAG: nuclear transport factor 2 family protein [Ferruginibacter sp.]